MANIPQVTGVFLDSHLSAGQSVGDVGEQFVKIMNQTIQNFADPAKDYIDPMTGITISAGSKFTDKIIQTQYLVNNSLQRAEFIVGMSINFAQTQFNIDKEFIRILQGS